MKREGIQNERLNKNVERAKASRSFLAKFLEETSKRKKDQLFITMQHSLREREKHVLQHEDGYSVRLGSLKLVTEKLCWILICGSAYVKWMLRKR